MTFKLSKNKDERSNRNRPSHIYILIFALDDSHWCDCEERYGGVVLANGT